ALQMASLDLGAFAAGDESLARPAHQAARADEQAERDPFVRGIRNQGSAGEQEPTTRDDGPHHGRQSTGPESAPPRRHQDREKEWRQSCAITDPRAQERLDQRHPDRHDEGDQDALETTSQAQFHEPALRNAHPWTRPVPPWTARGYEPFGK